MLSAQARNIPDHYILAPTPRKATKDERIIAFHALLSYHLRAPANFDKCRAAVLAGDPRTADYALTGFIGILDIVAVMRGEEPSPWGVDYYPRRIHLVKKCARIALRLGGRFHLPY